MRLELQQKQKQILTEKMIQSVEILQMTSQELKEYVNEVMLENPVVVGENPVILWQQLADGHIHEPPALGRPILYATTDRFLEHFGISYIRELPPLPSAQEKVDEPLTP